MLYLVCLPDCLYCSTPVDDAWIVNEHAVAIPHPDSKTSCHVVIAPRRHVAAFYDLDVQEQRAIWDLLRELQRRIAESFVVQGFDAGFVDVRSGAEPAHTHVHLIPRIAGESVERSTGAEWVDLGM